MPAHFERCLNCCTGVSVNSPQLVYENSNMKKVILVSWKQWSLWKAKRPWGGSRGTKLSKQETSCIKCLYDCSPQTNSVLGPSESRHYYKLNLWAFSPTGSLRADTAWTPEFILLFHIANEDRNFLMLSLVQNRDTNFGMFFQDR